MCLGRLERLVLGTNLKCSKIPRRRSREHCLTPSSKIRCQTRRCHFYRPERVFPPVDTGFLRLDVLQCLFNVRGLLRYPNDQYAASRLTEVTNGPLQIDSSSIKFDPAL